MESPKRVLLKISGEAIAGNNPDSKGIDPEFVRWLAEEIKKATSTGAQIAIVVGGGNIVRGAELAGNGLELATAHYMGMVSGVINGLAVMDMIQSHGQPARLMSSIRIDQVAEPFVRRKAIRHMEKGRIVLLVGGTGRPYVTHDTAAVTAALELGCEGVYKATQVDGVYDKDPHKFEDAVRFDKVTYQKAIEDADIKVMDKAAIGLAMEQEMPITIFKLEEDSIFKAVSGESIGTTVS